MTAPEPVSNLPGQTPVMLTLVRAFLNIAALATLCGAVVHFFADLAPGALPSHLLGTINLLTVALLVWVRLRLDRFALATVVKCLAWGLTLNLVLVAWGMGRGLHAPILGANGMFVFLLTLVAGRVPGRSLAVAQGCGLVLLLWAERAGYIDGAQDPRVSSAGVFTVQVSLVAAAYLAGALLARFLRDVVADAERREQSVQEARSLLEHFIGASPVALSLTELVGHRIIRVNRAFEQTFGYAASEVEGRSAMSLGLWIQPADREELLRLLEVHGEVRDWTALLMHRRNEPLKFKISAVRFDIDGVPHMALSAVDVTETERVRMEYAAMLEHAPVGMALTRQRRFVAANHALEQLFGMAPGELVGQHVAFLFEDKAAYEEDGKKVDAVLLQGRPLTLERQLRRRDGSLFWCRMLGTRVDDALGQGSNLWIVEDITERHALSLSLAQAKQAAEDASQAKSAFLANISHEVRTPLNGIMGLAQLALVENVDHAQRQRLLSRLVETADHLSKLMSDVLDFSKIEARKLELSSEQFDLIQLLQSVREHALPLALDKGLALQLQTNGHPSWWVTGDATRVRQILVNLLSNAIKFTATGSVTLCLEQARTDQVQLAVVDTGPGLSAEVQAQLFEPFVQGDNSTTRRHEGTGLGLAISRDLALAMGGQLGVDSRVGQGARFWLTLPLLAHEGRERAEALYAAEPLPDARLVGMRVLLVEDNAVNRLITTAFLQRWGIVVSEAVDGDEALQQFDHAVASGEGFHAILMDLHMPGLSGAEVTTLIRSRPAGAHVPILALTAAVTLAERDTAMRSGMNDFLTKPLDLQRLHEALLNWAPAVSG